MLWQLIHSPSLTTQATARPWPVRLVLAEVAKSIATLIAVRLLARLRTPPEYFAPDPYATEAPFLSDRWPGH